MAEEAAFLNALRRLELEQDRSQEIRPKVLDEVTLDGIVKHIQKLAASNDANRIIVMTGAGISTAAGIPDFRTLGTGLYDNLQKYNLPSPQSIFDISYFPTNPKPFFHLAKEIYPGNFKPTLCHYFIRLLEIKGLLLRSYTQNIDTLERRAGIADEHLVEAQGAFHLAHCITCGKEYPHEYVKEQVFADKIPLCTETDCAYEPTEEGEAYKGIVKPDIVFFGEALPKRFGELASKDLHKCDLLIVMGTSLTVQPFASLPSKVREDCPRLLINYEKVGEGPADPLMMLLGMGGTGFDFGDKAYRDVFLQGTCDERVKELAKRLGWEEELMSLYSSEHQKLAEQTKKLKEKEKESGQKQEKQAREQEQNLQRQLRETRQQLQESKERERGLEQQLRERDRHSTNPTTSSSSSNVVHESTSVPSTGGASPSATVDVNKVKKVIDDVLVSHYANLTSLKTSLLDLASWLYAAGLISDEVRETRSMEKFITEFKASLNFKRKLPQVEEHCQKFLNSFIAVRGSYADAAEALCDCWIQTIRNELGFDFNIIKK